MSGGWFDWLPGFLGGSSGAAMPPETFGPKAPIDPLGTMGMIPGDGTQPMAPTASPTSMAFTPGAEKNDWQNRMQRAMQRYRQAQQGGQPRQRMSEWFGPRRVG